jgi:hypothetical protein
VFGFIIAYLGRPRRIIAHEDPTRREIYGRTRCNLPTETGRHSQINSAERRHESPSSPPTRVHPRVHVHARTPSESASPRTSSRRKTPPRPGRGRASFSLFFSTARSIFMTRRVERETSLRSTFPIINGGNGEMRADRLPARLVSKFVRGCEALSRPANRFLFGDFLARVTRLDF